MNVHDLINTAWVNTTINKPLFDFASTERLHDEIHRSACIEELWHEATLTDEDETINLERLERFLHSAPINESLSLVKVDDQGNFVPEELPTCF